MHGDSGVNARGKPLAEAELSARATEYLRLAGIAMLEERAHGGSPARSAPASGGDSLARERLAKERWRERDSAIRAARQRGDTLQEAGARFGLSRERVRQIIARSGAVNTASSKAARARRNAQAARHRREEVLSAWREGLGLKAIATSVDLPQARVREVIKCHATTADAAARRRSLARTPRRLPRRKYSDERLIDALAESVKASGCIPTSSRYGEIAKAQRLPSIATISNRFGGWNAALRAAGLTPTAVCKRPYRRDWTEQKCLEALQSLAIELGRLPALKDYRQLSAARHDLPSYSTLRIRVGPWSTIASLLEPEKKRVSASAATPVQRPDTAPPAADRRTAHLVALVQRGETLEQAGRVYGIGRERVRQLLKEQGVSASRAPGKGRNGPRRPQRDASIAPAVEELWRKGMRYREVAEHLGIPQETVRELVCERVPRAERVRLIAEKLKCRYISDDEILLAIGDAAQILGHPPAKPAYERLRAQGLIEGPDAATISHRLGWSQAVNLAP